MQSCDCDDALRNLTMLQEGGNAGLPTSTSIGTFPVVLQRYRNMLTRPALAQLVYRDCTGASVCPRWRQASVRIVEDKDLPCLRRREGPSATRRKSPDIGERPVVGVEPPSARQRSTNLSHVDCYLAAVGDHAITVSPVASRAAAR